VVLFDGLTGVRFSACPRFAPTLSFRHIGLTGDLIYIKSRWLDFFFFSFLLVFHLAPPLSTAPPAVSPPPCPPCATRRPAPLPLLLAAASACAAHRPAPPSPVLQPPPPPHLRATAPSCAAITLCRRHCATATTMPLLHCPPSPLSSKAAVIQSHRHCPVPSCAITGALSVSRRCVFSRCRRGHAQASIMGRDKRKGKEPVVEPPKKKKTRAQKEAERAAMAARATDD
jgi:hypothetical protein